VENSPGILSKRSRYPNEVSDDECTEQRRQRQESWRDRRDVTFRQIFTDGRPLPKDPEPSWNGYSTGRWQGDALVVETNGLRDGTWLDRNGSPMTDAARMIERFRRVNYGRLEVELTVDDPKAYTRPWSITLKSSCSTQICSITTVSTMRNAVHLIGR
jgi:hypothetical protein